jgi:hypothetical protein
MIFFNFGTVATGNEASLAAASRFSDTRRNLLALKKKKAPKEPF